MKKAFIVVAVIVWLVPTWGEEAKNTLSSPRPLKATSVASAQKASISDSVSTNKSLATVSIADSAKGKLAKLVIKSQPDSAAIVLDTVEKGLTPAAFDSVSPGPHVILIKKKGYFAKKISLTLSPDSTHEISATLVKPGCVVVKSDPPGATLFLDNKNTGKTPYENMKIKPGNYTLRLELEHHDAVERPIVIAETGCDTISISLPFTKAYSDSVQGVKRAMEDKKSKFKRTVNYVAAGAFLVFGAVIFFIEAGNGH